MPSVVIEDAQRQIGFSDRDVANIRSLAAVLEPAIEQVVDRVYERLMADPRARTATTGGWADPDHLPGSLRLWLADMLKGDYGPTYWARRAGLESPHLHPGLVQAYLLVGVEILRQELHRAVLRARVPRPIEAIHSLQKLLTLETVVMLDAYKELCAASVRKEERDVAAERLTRSEHFAQLGQLAATLAHEIKNPLAGISGAIQVIRDGMAPDDARREVIREVIGQIHRLDAAVKDLLVYAGPRAAERTPCQLDVLLRRTLQVIRDAPALQPVRIAVACPDRLPPVLADGRQIEQLIMNLIFNAAHACEPGGTIDVELSPIDRRVRMTITDHGHGMDETVLARAFEPFFTTKAKGTGLGLPICRRIVEVHQGTIRLASRRNVGTRITVELPIVAAPAGPTPAVGNDGSRLDREANTGGPR